MAGKPANQHSGTDSAVPLDQRLSRGSLTMAWWGICSAMFYLVVDAALAMGFGTRNAIIGLLATLLMAVGEHGYSSAWLDLVPAGGPVEHGWWNCFTYFMGVWVLMMYTWDYARFGRPEDSDYHARFNFGMPFYAVAFLLNGLAGVFLAAAIPTEVSVVLSIVQLMGLWGLLFVWITQTRLTSSPPSR